MARLIVEERPFTVHLGRAEGERLTRWRILDRIDGVEGALFRGRIVAKAPDLGGAFVEVERRQPMLVRWPSAKRRQLVEGAAVLVQGVRDGFADKPPRGTATLRLAGPHLVWRSDFQGPGITDHVPKPLRQPLLGRAATLLADQPLALTAAAAEADDAILAAEARTLIAARDEVLAAFEAAELGPLDGVDRWVHRIVAPWTRADDAPAVAPVLQRLAAARWLQGLVPDVAGAEDPWAEAGVGEGRQVLLAATVGFGPGARLAFATTPACTTVDVDRGAATASVSALNRAAVEMLIQQIVARGIGGQIVVDFLDPGGAAGGQDLEAALREAVAQGDPDIDVIGVLRGGLAVLERPRHGLSLTERLTETCAACGEITARARWAILEDALLALTAEPLTRVRCRLASDLQAVLSRRGITQAASTWLARHGRSLDHLELADLPAGAWRLEQAE